MEAVEEWMIKWQRLPSPGHPGTGKATRVGGSLPSRRNARQRQSVAVQLWWRKVVCVSCVCGQCCVALLRSVTWLGVAVPGKTGWKANVMPGDGSVEIPSVWQEWLMDCRRFLSKRLLDSEINYSWSHIPPEEMGFYQCWKLPAVHEIHRRTY